jgi:hypothetical protein
MTDDICGAECVDGSECQHPADSCPVPSHSDADADNPQGRDFVLGPEDHDALLTAARDGFSKAGCARAAGVQKQNLERYLNAEKNADFRDAFMRARHEGERKLVTGPLRGPEDPDEPEWDGQHARFLLASSFGYTKTEKRELENTGEDALSEIVIDFTDVDT